MCGSNGNIGTGQGAASMTACRGRDFLQGPIAAWKPVRAGRRSSSSRRPLREFKAYQRRDGKAGRQTPQNYRMLKIARIEKRADKWPKGIRKAASQPKESHVTPNHGSWSELTDNRGHCVDGKEFTYGLNTDCQSQMTPRPTKAKGKVANCIQQRPHHDPRL